MRSSARPATDLDFATDARPDDILAIVTPLADAHWEVGREFGTIGARFGDDTFEITTYRADEYDGTTRKPVVAFGDDLEGDLARRDFTVNAMALRLPDLVLVDPARRRRAPPRRARSTPLRRPRCRSETTRCGCCAPPASRRSSGSPSPTGCARR